MLRPEHVAPPLRWLCAFACDGQIGQQNYGRPVPCNPELAFPLLDHDVGHALQHLPKSRDLRMEVLPSFFFRIEAVFVLARLVAADRVEFAGDLPSIVAAESDDL